MTEPPTEPGASGPGPLRSAVHALAWRATRPRWDLADRGAVALTFDDGPHPDYTPQILDVLAEHGARATFFVVGRRVRRHPELVRRTLAAGHAVGSHSYSHADGWEVPWPRLVRDLWGGRRALEEAAGGRRRAFRPPKGYFSDRAAAAAAVCGLRPWLWTVDPCDWRPGITADEIVADLGPLSGGDVVLLHDAIELPLASEAADREATVAALPAIIAAARERGLRLESVEGPR